MKRIYYIMATLLLCVASVNAQVKIDSKDDLTGSHKGAILDLQSTETAGKGVLFPRVTLTSLTSFAPVGEDEDAVEGMVIYNDNEALGKGIYVWDGAKWRIVKNTVVATIDVNEITIEGSETMLLDETITLLATVKPDNATNTSVVWSIVSGGATINEDGELTATAVGTVEVKAEAADGGGASKEFTIQVVCPIPAQPGEIKFSATLPITINLGGTFTASVDEVLGAVSYEWNLPDGLTGDSETNSITITGSAGTYSVSDISVKAVNKCGSKSAESLGTGTNNITINDCSAAPVVGEIVFGTTPINLNGTFTASVTNVAGVSYTWSLPQGLTATPSTGSSITIKGEAGNTYDPSSIKVTATNACGSTVREGAGADIVVRDCSAVPAQPGTITFSKMGGASSTTITASVTAVAGATSYTWTLPNGFSASLTTTAPEITITLPNLDEAGATYDASGFTVRAVNACGTSAANTGSGTITVSKCGAYIENGVWLRFQCYNLGADTSKPWDTFSTDITGDYYQWGNASPSGTYSAIIGTWSNTNFETGNTWNNNPCPTGWRVPTLTEWKAVRVNNTWIAAPGSIWEENGSGGRLAGGALYLPAAGWRYSADNGSLQSMGNTGYYWCVTNNGTSRGYVFNVFSTTQLENGMNRENGSSVRCVK